MIPLCTVFSDILVISSSRYATILARAAGGVHPRIGFHLIAHDIVHIVVATPGIPVVISITSPVAARVAARAALHLSPSQCAALDTVDADPDHPFLAHVAIAHAIADPAVQRVLVSIHVPHFQINTPAATPNTTVPPTVMTAFFKNHSPRNDSIIPA